MKELDCRKCKDSYQSRSRYLGFDCFICLSPTSSYYNEIVFTDRPLVDSCKDFKEKE